MSPDRPPKHNREDPLPADLVIVDEASMVDLPTMNLLLDALAPDTALLLVGDPDQLPSVEAGALLGDLLAGAEEAASGSGDGPLAGSVLHLTKVYRSSAGILDTAAAVRAGDAAALEASFREDGVRIRHPDTPEKTAAELAESYRAAVSASRDATDARKSVPELFPIYGDHSVLSPLRRGPWGTESLNRRISQILSGGGGPFPGMPVMVTGNDQSRNLWNGDRGVLL